MTREELLQLIADVQQLQSELDEVEVKAAQGGTPKRLYEGLSAFANKPRGGVLLFGVDESRKFQMVGVGNAQKLQADITNVCSADMEPALRPDFTIEEINGQTIVAVEVPEVPIEQKPCYFNPAGLQKGSYIRVGNTNRQMTDYEIFGYVSARTQPAFDEEPVRDATLDDLDRAKLEGYVAQLRRQRPQASYLNQPFEQILERRRIVRKIEGVSSRN